MTSRGSAVRAMAERAGLRAGQHRGQKGKNSAAPPLAEPTSSLSVEAKRQLVEIFDGQKEKMTNVFFKWDSDGDGKITKKEVSSTISQS